MNREERERMLDRLLDDALAARSEEPRPGLEDRILAQLRAQPERRLWWQWAWAPAVAALVIVAIGVYVAQKRQSEPRIAETQRRTEQSAKLEHRDAETRRTTEQAAKSERRDAEARRTTVERERSLKVQSQVLPRLEVFPSPAPLTAEEQALLVLLRRDPAEARRTAQLQEADREQVQKYLETGVVPMPQPSPAQPMR